MAVRRELIEPRIPVTRHGIPVVARIPTIVIGAGRSGEVQFQLRDNIGNPVNLTEYGFGDSESLDAAESTLDIVMVEGVSREQRYAGTADVIDAETGLIQFLLRSANTQMPGVYYGEVRVKNDGDILTGYPFYMIINWTASAQPEGPPSLEEIRVHMRDSQSDENYLIKELDFADTEIAESIVRAVLFWNDSPPPIGRHDSTNFPYRSIWVDGIVAELCLIAAEWYRRNYLKHTAGGVAVDDLDRERQYLGEYDRRKKAFTDAVKAAKVSINAGLGMMSGYAVRRGTW